MEKITYGQWVRSTRKQRGISQGDLLERGGFDRSHISKIENGRIALPEKSTRDRIHAVLGTTDEDLVSVGILVRFRAPDGSTVYQPADQAFYVLNDRNLATAEVADEVPPHMRASFAKVSELSPERQDQLKALIDTFYEADEAYRAQIRKDAQRRREEGIED